MGRMIYDFTKSTLERSSREKIIFIKEFKKAAKVLQPHEMEKLMHWLDYFTADKPELKELWERMTEEIVS